MKRHLPSLGLLTLILFSGFCLSIVSSFAEDTSQNSPETYITTPNALPPGMIPPVIIAHILLSGPTDITPATPGNSALISATSVTETTLTLNWTAATDDTTDLVDLEYLAYYSSTNNIDSVANCESNGTAIGLYATNITSRIVAGLLPSSTYYFNIIVRDGAGNKAIYSTLTQATLADTIDPVPGNAGTITVTNVLATSLTLNWTKATDNTSPQSSLEYLAYYSSSNNISTVANCEALGTAVGSYAADIDFKPVTGLSSSTPYYFNVIVRDQTGNKAVYSTLTQTTTDGTAPTPGNSGTITSANVASTSLTLNWTMATDDVSAQANLQYLAYYSTSNNITTVANCESNGTAVGSYAANITTQPVTGLTSSTPYYFNVVVRDEAGNKAAYSPLAQPTTDATAPTPGNSGIITATSVASTSLTLNWTVATDDVSAQANLQYLAYYSTSNNITTVANCESNGTAIGSYTANITTQPATGLTSSTPYYFNVVVRDQAGNKAAYSPLSQSTTDGTAPTPGNSGTITSTSIASTSLTLNWTVATDDVSSQANLQYLAYYSTSNNISSIANCESNGTAVGSYEANISTKNVTGLTSSTPYYFNIIVKDESDNKALYSTLMQTTTDVSPPTPGNSGTITSASVASTLLTLNWSAATDDVSSQANLEYLAYYSTSNNITSWANCESNGTAIGSYAANITTKDVTGLTSSTTYYFNVVVRDQAGNKAAYSPLTQATTDVTAPTPGNSGTITSASVVSTSLTLNWTAATDDVSPQENLEYLAYYSTSDNITSWANCESNGTAIGSYAANIATKEVMGLTSSTTYYFNVVVRDQAGNKTAYSPLTQATTDVTNPTPGNSGTLTSSNVDSTSLTLNWSPATDDFSAQANLEYLTYYSTSNNIISVANCEENGTAVGSYTANINTADVTGLTISTTYYFNVVVQDEAGNKAAYTSFQQSTTDGIPIDYVARWKFNNNGTDESGSYNLTTENGSPAYSSSSPKEGSHYLTLDGSSSLASSGSYDLTASQLSMAAWVYVDSSVSGTYFQAVDLGQAGIYYHHGEAEIRGGPTSGSYANYTITTDVWYHVVFTYDNSLGSQNIKLYINGSTTPDATWDSTTDITGINNPFVIGRYSTGTDFWDGNIDDVIIYDRVLSGAEISQIYSTY